MKKTIFYGLTITGMLVYTACKKEKTTLSNVQKDNAVITNNQKVKQLILKVEPALLTSKIKEFKTLAQRSNISSKTMSNQNLPIDSAIWLLENTLNYDFDSNTSGNPLSDSTGYEITLSNSDTISATQLSSAYNYFYNYIYQKITQNKLIKIIDVYAHINSGKLIISSNIIFTENTAGNKTEGVCDPYSNITARWSLPLTNTPPFTYCTNYSTNNDGPTLCNIKLNCTQYNPPCNPYFYTNVVTLLFDNMSNHYPNALFYYYISNGSPSNVCNPPALTDVQLNNYINGCKTLGIFNVPTSPSGYIITNYSVNATMYVNPPVPPSGGYTILWWYLNVTYAIPSCGGGSN